jgi:hypothetical protein
VRSVLGRALKRFDDDRFDVRIFDCARRAGARRIAKPVDPMPDEPLAPVADRVFVDLKPSGDLPVLTALRAGQDDPRPQRQRLPGLAARR